MATLSTTKVAYHGGTADSGSAYVGTSYNGNSQEVCTTRFKFTTNSYGATNFSFQTSKALCDVAGAGDESYDSIARIRFAVTTSASQYKTYKGNAGYSCSYYAQGNGYIYGSLSIKLLPNTDYYLWIFPGSQYAGWTRHQLSSCTVTTTGSYGTPSTITADDGVFGSPINVSVSNAVSGVTNTLSVTCAGNTETLTLNGSGEATWTPSLSTYGALVTSSATATAEFECETFYSGTSWGTSTKTITVSFPEASCKPVINSVSFAPDNSAITDPTITAFVKGYSKPVTTISATFMYGAQAATNAYSVTINGATVSSGSSSVTGNVLSVYGTVTATITVTDTRGFSETTTATFTAYDYFTPYLTNVTLFRCDSNGIAADNGTYLSAYAIGNIASINGQNGMTLTVAWAPASGTYGAENPLSNGVTAVLPGLSADATYNARITITDKIGGTNNSVELITGQNWGIKFTVANSKVSACGLGKAPESSSVLEIPSTWSVKRGTARALFSDDFIDLIYPVGSIYISTSNTSPTTWFGGTWQRIEDRFLLAAGTNHAAGTTGGSETHTLTVDEIPSHSHDVKYNLEAWRGNTGGNIRNVHDTGSSGVVTTTSVGSGQAHNNMPPYIAVYVWERTA